MTESPLPSPDDADSALISRVPYSFARRHGALPFRLEQGLVETLVRSDLINVAALSEYRRAFGRPVRVRKLSAHDFDTTLETIYSRHASSTTASPSSADDKDEVDLDTALAGVEDILAADDDAPVIRLINALLTRALNDHASDIHFEIFESRAAVRFRVDGRLTQVFTPPVEAYTAIASRLKVMASLDIAEKRLPQDGRFSLRLGRRPVDVRISTIPSSRGERIVLRLLDKQEERLDLEKLGLDRATFTDFSALVQKPHGIILVTGPTGSGKTTTLYSALQTVDRDALNVMTVEDPVEYELEGISQSQVHAAIDMTFARALRSILRQDPDVIMIGEIRDTETARIAVQASLTGHLVLSTLHTNDAVGAVTRLIDMGVEPYLLSSSLLGVLAQRLVRKLCPHCKQEEAADKSERNMTGAATICHPVGCPACAGSGYRGRLGVFELVTVDHELGRLIHEGASEGVMRQAAAKRPGALPLAKQAYRLVATGVTSIEEVVRVVEEK